MADTGVTGRKFTNGYIKAAWTVWSIAAVWLALDLFLRPCDVYAFDDSSWGAASWVASTQGLICSYSDADGVLVVVTSPGVSIFALVLLALSLPLFALGVHRGLLARPDYRANGRP